MVNPLLFDLHFQLDSKAFDVVEVFGSGDSTPRKDLRTVMHVSSLFPSTSTTAEGTKGGLILLKLRWKQPPDDEMTEDHPSGNSNGGTMLFTISYSERSGATTTCSRWATLNSTAGRAAVKSTRKGVLLARYVQLVREWIADKYSQPPTPPITCASPSAPFAFQASSPPSFLFGPPVPVTYAFAPSPGSFSFGSAPVTSAFAPSPASFSFGSAPASAALADTLPQATAATASGGKALEWNARFAAFLDHFEREMEQVDDDSLSKEVEVLTTLASKASELRPSYGSAGDMSIQLALWQHEVPDCHHLLTNSHRPFASNSSADEASHIVSSSSLSWTWPRWRRYPTTMKTCDRHTVCISDLYNGRVSLSTLCRGAGRASSCVSNRRRLLG